MFDEGWLNELNNSQKQYDKWLSAIDRQLDSRVSTINKQMLDNVSEQFGRQLCGVKRRFWGLNKWV